MRLDTDFARYVIYCGSLGVFALGLAREAFVLQIGTGTLLQDLRQFDLDAENSVPAWWASSLMLAASVMLYVLGAQARAAGAAIWKFWALLALAFLALSIDEAASFHEGLIAPLRAAFGFDGVLFYAWVVPAAIALAIFGSVLLPLMRLVPRPLRRRFLFAGAIFVSGAMGMEMAGAWLDHAGLRGTPAYALAILAEEGGEILGLTLFTSALLDALAGRFGPAAAALPAEMAARMGQFPAPAAVAAGQAARAGTERMRAGEESSSRRA